MNASPAVSVIMPAFNGARYIREAMASVAAQTRGDWELVVIDDGSSDGTAEAASRFAAENPALSIKVLRQPNGGAAAARNAGIRAAAGRYLAFLDCDDVWLPHKLETQLPALEKDPEIGLVFSDTGYFGERYDGRPPCVLPDFPSGGPDLAELFSGNCISTLTVVVRREILEMVGGFDESVSVGEDYDLWLRIASKSRVVCVRSVVSKYRVHAANMSRVPPESEERLLRDLIKVRAGALARDPWLAGRLPFRVMDRCYYRLYLNLATFMLKRGDSRRGRENARAYLAFNRLSPLPYALLLLSWLPGPLNRAFWALKRPAAESKGGG